MAYISPMPKEKTIYVCARLTGVLLLGAAVLHATLGTAEVMMAVKTGEVRPGIQDTLHVIWIYSSVMLVLSGIWALFLAGELKQMKRRAWWQGVLLGLGYFAGSVGAMAATRVYAHLVVFAMIGLLMLIPLLRWAGHFRRTAKGID